MYRYVYRNVVWKIQVWQLQYYCYRYVNCKTCNTSFNICCFFFFAFCVHYGIKWLYIISINIIFILVRLDVLILVWYSNCGGNDQLEAETHHQLYRLHCENSSYNYNLKACLNSFFCKRKECVLNNINTIIAAELLLLKLPTTYSCPSVKECYSFVWCHCFFWIQPYLQLFLGNGCMNAPTDNGKHGHYISGHKVSSTVLYIKCLYFEAFKVLAQ